MGLKDGGFIAWDEVITDVFNKLDKNEKYTIDDLKQELFAQVYDYGADGFKDDNEVKKFIDTLTEQLLTVAKERI